MFCLTYMHSYFSLWATMNELRLRIYREIINDSPSGRTSVFNKICGVTIFISIFFAVIITENSVDYKFGDQIDFWIGLLVVCFALNTFVVYGSHHLKRNTANVGKAFCVMKSHLWQLLI